jgi:hypothetical protein
LSCFALRHNYISLYVADGVCRYPKYFGSVSFKAEAAGEVFGDDDATTSSAEIYKIYM